MCLVPPDLGARVCLPSNKLAIVYDTDGSFDIRRLAAAIRCRLVECGMQPTTQDSSNVSEAVQHILSLIHVFHPTSSLQLVANIRALPAWHGSHFPTSEIVLVAVDSISAHYWSDRHQAEQMRSYSSAATDASLTRFSSTTLNPLQHVLTAMETLRASHAPIIFLTNWGLNPLLSPTSPSEPGFQLFKQHLHPFPTISSEHSPVDGHLPLTHHITFQPVPVTQYRYFGPVDPAERQSLSERKSPSKVELSGFVRSKGTEKTARFSFAVNSE